MRLAEIIAKIEQVVPLHFQESWDNAGLQIGDIQSEISSVLLSVDVTEAVLDEAIRKQCNLIISHHPLLFSGLKSIGTESMVERCVVKAIRNRIAIYSAHTNVDKWSEGVSRRMADKLGLVQTELLAPSSADGAIGLGFLGYLPEAMEATQFLQQLKTTFQIPTLRYAGDTGKRLRKIAVCGGSGASLLKQVVASGADIFVSADFKHHDFLEATEGVMIADVGHFESEQCTKEIFFEILSKKNSTFALHFSDADVSPIRYL